jgi:PPOX class probable F420-dependent enzyme
MVPSACDPQGWMAVSELDGARYISLTTFKKDGSPVSSPVWITGAAGTYVFTTGDKAWKTRRLLRNSSVQVRVCNMRGHVKPMATRYVGTGKVADSADVLAAAEQALAAKYGWQFSATKLFDGLRDRFGQGDRQVVVAIQLSLNEA